MKKWLSIVIVLVAAYILMLWYTAEKLKEKDFTQAYHDCHKVWSARGLYGNGIEQNSLKSLKRAFDEGALGAEIDLHYDTEMKKFIISHDHPHKDKNGKLVYALKEGKLLTLEKVFQTFPSKNYFWLDYKNLGKLNDKETADAIARLKEITEKNALRERVYIEGTHPLKLAEYTQAGFKTIFDIQPLPEKYFTTTLVINAYKFAYAKGDFTVMGMHYGHLDAPVYAEKTQELLGDIPVFLYHVPDDAALLKKLVKNPQVRVLLIGRDINLNRFDIMNCNLEQEDRRDHEIRTQ
jgi:glycerophosphoryl diester phosphodiesterase